MELEELEAKVFARCGNIGLGVLSQVLRQASKGNIIHIKRHANTEKQKTITRATQAIQDITAENWELIDGNTWCTAENKTLKSLIFRKTVPSSIEDLPPIEEDPPSTGVLQEEHLKVKAPPPVCAPVEGGPPSAKTTRSNVSTCPQIPDGDYKVLKASVDTWKDHIQPDMTGPQQGKSLKLLKAKVLDGNKALDIELKLGTVMGFIHDRPWMKFRNLADWLEKGYMWKSMEQLCTQFPNKSVAKSKPGDCPIGERGPEKKPICIQKEVV